MSFRLGPPNPLASPEVIAQLEDHFKRNKLKPPMASFSKQSNSTTPIATANLEKLKDIEVEDDLSTHDNILASK